MPPPWRVVHKMHTNLQLGTADVIVLLVLAVLMVLAARIVCGFFKGGKKK